MSARDSERAAEDLYLLLQVGQGGGPAGMMPCAFVWLEHVCWFAGYCAASITNQQQICLNRAFPTCILQAGELPGSRQRIARMLLHADSLGNEAFAGRRGRGGLVAVLSSSRCRCCCKQSCCMESFCLLHGEAALHAAPGPHGSPPRCRPAHARLGL